MSADFRRRRLSNINQKETEEAAAALQQASIGGGRVRRLSMSPEMGTKAKEETPFTLKTCGTFSCHGVEPGIRQGETTAKINQDRGGMVYPLAENPNMAMFMVFDGHGANGDKVSQYTIQNIDKKMAAKLKGQNSSAVPKALEETFAEVDQELKADKSIDAELSGTTAVVVVYEFLDKNKAKVWAANAGDSRAVLQKKDKVQDLTEDQKPDTPAEQKRITSAGGYVSPPEVEWGGPARVWLDANMTLPGLAMARSIGDHLVLKVGVIPNPVVTTFDIDTTKGDETIVLASDGVWEFIESEAACQILKKERAVAKGTVDATREVTKLIETAAAKWRQEEGDYRDDITAIVVKLKGIHEAHFAK